MVLLVFTLQVQLNRKFGGFYFKLSGKGEACTAIYAQQFKSILQSSPWLLVKIMARVQLSKHLRETKPQCSWGGRFMVWVLVSVRVRVWKYMSSMPIKSECCLLLFLMRFQRFPLKCICTQTALDRFQSCFLDKTAHCQVAPLPSRPTPTDKSAHGNVSPWCCLLGILLGVEILGAATP